LAAAIASLLAVVAPAQGQTLPDANTAQPAEASAAAPEPAPTEATEVATAVVEPAPATPPPAPGPSPAPARPDRDPVGAAADVTSNVAGATSAATSDIAATAPPEADRPVSGLVAKTAENASEAVAKAQVAEKLPELAAQVAKRATELSDEAQARTIELAAAAENAILPALPLPGDAPAGPAAPGPDRPLPLHQAPVGKGLLTGAWLGHLADGPGGLPANPVVAGAAATDLLRVGMPTGVGELRAVPAFSGADFFTGTAQRFNAPVPPDSPGFPSGSTTGVGTSGSGATFFVPIAALLALLALASPAILRRLRELPDFPAPTPFVCALERPG